MKIFLNPGHSPDGQPDPGAVNEDYELRECDITATIGNLVKDHLLRAGCQVLLLQSDNLCGEGEGDNVCETANLWEADLFVSIHCNAANGSARGAETFCYEEQGDGYRVADFIQTQLWNAMHDIDNEFPDRGVKEGPQLMVLRHTDMPAVLVECGFIDNAADAWLMVQYPADVAAAIARGITDYWCYRSDKRWP